MAPNTPTPYIEQPAFHYFECSECGFDSIQPADYSGPEDCPLCAGDHGRANKMSRRVARDIDDPEGVDARRGERTIREVMNGER